MDDNKLSGSWTRKTNVHTRWVFCSMWLGAGSASVQLFPLLIRWCCNARLMCVLRRLWRLPDWMLLNAAAAVDVLTTRPRIADNWTTCRARAREMLFIRVFRREWGGFESMCCVSNTLVCVCICVYMRIYMRTNIYIWTRDRHSSHEWRKLYCNRALRRSHIDTNATRHDTHIHSSWHRRVLWCDATWSHPCVQSCCVVELFVLEMRHDAASVCCLCTCVCFGHVMIIIIGQTWAYMMWAFQRTRYGRVSVCVCCLVSSSAGFLCLCGWVVCFDVGHVYYLLSIWHFYELNSQMYIISFNVNSFWN